MKRAPLLGPVVVLACFMSATTRSVLASYVSKAPGPAIPQNDPNCAGMKLDVDDDVDQSDFGIFQRCYSGTKLALPECTGAAGGLPASGTPALHGRPVDVLPDGHTLLFVRARFYDLKHGRWLQRDPTGFADGGNLYEAFGNNPLRHTDPEGTYYKLWSTWENGAEIYWQDISPMLWWWTGKPSAEFSLGKYYYSDGRKFVTYRGFVACDPLQPAMYLVPFEALEQWAKQDISLSAYDRFVFQHGIPIGRDGEVLKRNLLTGGLAQILTALQDEQERQSKELANWATTPLGTRTVEMLLSGGVDPITERNISGREIREHIVRLAETGATMYVGGRLLAPAPATTAGSIQPRLIHLTDSTGAAGIDVTGVLRGNIYAGPLSNAGQSGLAITWRTGLSPSSYQAAVPIPQAATGAFGKPVPVGPFTFFQRMQGVQYTANGVLDLRTGAFTRTGVNWTQVRWYGADVGIDALSVGSAGYWLHLQDQAQETDQ